LIADIAFNRRSVHSDIASTWSSRGLMDAGWQSNAMAIGFTDLSSGAKTCADNAFSNA
jgi:hypothetical protein